MKVFISGAGGFIGSSLVNYFVLQGHHVVALSRRVNFLAGDAHPNLTNVFGEFSGIDFGGLLDIYKPDAFIHCVGSATVSSAQKNPLLDYQNTVSSVAIALDAIKNKSHNTHFVMLSSAAVYGDKQGPLTEEMACMPISIYGHHKYLAELLVREYVEQFKLTATILRPFSVYGSEMKKQVIYDICKKFMDESKQSVLIEGMGSIARDFINIADFVRAVDLVIRQKIIGVLNMGTGISTSLSDLAILIQSKVSPEKSFHFSGDVSKLNPLKLIADVKKSNQFGIYPEIKIEDGIIDVIQKINN